MEPERPAPRAVKRRHLALVPDGAQKTELVKLRYFEGLSIEETAAALGISERTAKRHWTYARAWLLDAIARGPNKLFSSE